MVGTRRTPAAGVKRPCHKKSKSIDPETSHPLACSFFLATEELKAFAKRHDINICGKCKRYHIDKGHVIPQVDCGRRMQCERGVLQSWGKKVLIRATYAEDGTPDDPISSRDSSSSEESEDEGPTANEKRSASMKAFWADIRATKEENLYLRKKMEEYGKKHGFELWFLRTQLLRSNKLLTFKSNLICDALKQGKDIKELHLHYSRLLEDQEAAHDRDIAKLDADFPIGPFPSAESEEDAVVKAVRKTLRRTQKGCGFKRKAKVLLTVIKKGKLFKDDGRKAFYDLACDHYREIFKNWRVLEKIDTSPDSSLNMSAVDKLRELEGLDLWGRGSLPSKGSFSYNAMLLEKYAPKVIPVTRELTTFGDIVKFDYERLVRMLIETYGLTDVAKSIFASMADGGNMKPLDAAFSADGADLTKKYSFVVFGLKMIDGRCRDENGELLFIEKDIERRERWKNIQSCNHAFPFLLIFAKDNKTLYE